MGRLGLMLPLLIALGIVFLLIFLNIVTVSFGKLGLSPEDAILLLLVTVTGSMINIPVARRQTEYGRRQPLYSRLLLSLPPGVTRQVIAVNVGGAVVPVVFAAYLLPRVPLVATLVSTVVVAIAARLYSKPIPGVGIVTPAWVAPLTSAVLALLLARHNAAPVAYISGGVGTLIGADLLNWRNLRALRSRLISIGGAGVFDGIFLSGMIAVLITSV